MLAVAGAATAMPVDSAVVMADGITGTMSVLTVADSPQMETDTPQLSVDSVTMGGAGRPVTRADRERAEADFQRDRPDGGRQVTFDGWPSHWSVAIGLLVSDDSKVWARGGPLRRQFILPESFSLRAIADDKLYGVATDELGVQRVAVLDRR